MDDDPRPLQSAKCKVFPHEKIHFFFFFFPFFHFFPFLFNFIFIFFFSFFLLIRQFCPFLRLLFVRLSPSSSYFLPFHHLFTPQTGLLQIFLPPPSLPLVFTYSSPHIHSLSSSVPSQAIHRPLIDRTPAVINHLPPRLPQPFLQKLGHPRPSFRSCPTEDSHAIPGFVSLFQPSESSRSSGFTLRSTGSPTLGRLESFHGFICKRATASHEGYSSCQ